MSAPTRRDLLGAVATLPLVGSVPRGESGRPSSTTSENSPPARGDGAESRPSHATGWYRSVETGRMLAREQVAYGAWKGGTSLERFDDGRIRYGGEVFAPVDEEQ